jgi:hypothetical protein
MNNISYFKGTKKVLSKGKNVSIEYTNNQVLKDLGITCYLVDNITKHQKYLLCPFSICFCAISTKRKDDFCEHILLHKNMKDITDCLYDSYIETDINKIIKNYEEFHSGTLFGKEDKPKPISKKRPNELEMLLDFNVKFHRSEPIFDDRSDDPEFEDRSADRQQLLNGLNILVDVIQEMRDEELDEFINNL